MIACTQEGASKQASKQASKGAQATGEAGADSDRDLVICAGCGVQSVTGIHRYVQWVECRQKGESNRGCTN